MLLCVSVGNPTAQQSEVDVQVTSRSSAWIPEPLDGLKFVHELPFQCSSTGVAATSPLQPTAQQSDVDRHVTASKTLPAKTDEVSLVHALPFQRWIRERRLGGQVVFGVSA